MRAIRSATATTLLLLLALALAGKAVDATRFNFRNYCAFTVNLWDNSVFRNIPPKGGVYAVNAAREGLMWRHGYNPEATLAEFTVKDGTVWYDLSIIPPGTGWCSSYDDCHAVANGRKGFNVAMAIVPRSNTNGANCRAIFCLADRCSDAFLFPTDNVKVHSCPDATIMDVVFCPGGISGGASSGTDAPGSGSGSGANNDNGDDPTPAPTPVPTPAPTTRPPAYRPHTAPPATPAAYTRANFEYRGQQAGNVPGSYNMVTDLASCARTQIGMQNPVGPLSEEVTMVFRGPMEIYNIAVFGGAPDAWHRQSWYTRGGASENLVFMNNRNADYSGQNRWGPQIFASADGRSSSPTPVTFAGSLGEASDPSRVGGGPGIDTGVEVNIMTMQKCFNDCRGFHDGTYSYHGWGGDRKIFVTRVLMPMSNAQPNLPAIWMLNAQIMYTGQYNSCNCRGMGAAGGCGELDVAEVIENQNPARDRISTHHYFYDGAVPNPAGGDNFASRPSSRTATYVTILDSTVGGGLIKIVEVDWFDFTSNAITNAQVQSWVNA